MDEDRFPISEGITEATELRKYFVSIIKYHKKAEKYRQVSRTGYQYQEFQ
jgi:hypothetical protein